MLLVVAMAATGASGPSPAAAFPVELVSVDANSRPLAPAALPSISFDGQFVGFSQSVSNTAVAVSPVIGWIRDRGAPATALIPTPQGLAANSTIGQSVISRDGCFAAYAGSNPKQNEIVAFDRCATTPAPVVVQQLPTTAKVLNIALSAHGRYFAYTLADPTGAPDSVVWVDRDGDGNGVLDDSPLNDASTKRLANADDPTLGDEGVTRLVGLAANLGKSDFQDAVLWDPVTGSTTAVSTSADPQNAVTNGRNGLVTMTPDARFVSFASTSTNLVEPPLATNLPQIWIRDMSNGALALVSHDGSGAPGNNGSIEPSISADGTQIAFATTATNLLPATTIPSEPSSTTPPVTRIAVSRGYDLLVAVDAGGFFATVSYDRVSNQANGSAIDASKGVNDQPRISSNGRAVAFTSGFGSVLVSRNPPLADNVSNIFVASRPTTLSMTSATFTSGVLVGKTSAAKTLTVKNSGISSVFPAQIKADGDFQVTGGTCTLGAWISPGQSCTITVVFKPTAEGQRSGTVTLAETGFQAMTVTGKVSATGTVPPPTTEPAPTTQPITFGLAISPNPAPFGVIRVGVGAPLGFTVTNTGNADEAITSAALGGTHPGDYAITANGCDGATLQPAQTCPITVTFTPKAAGNRAATLKVSAGGGSATAALAGVGTFKPTIRVSPNVISLGMVGVAIGVGFPAGATITLHWDTRPETFTATADANGNINVQIPVGPDEQTGNRNLQVVDQPGAFTGITTPVLIVDNAAQPPTDRNPAFSEITSLILR